MPQQLTASSRSVEAGRPSRHADIGDPLGGAGVRAQQIGDTRGMAPPRLSAARGCLARRRAAARPRRAGLVLLVPCPVYSPAAREFSLTKAPSFAPFGSL